MPGGFKDIHRAWDVVGTTLVAVFVPLAILLAAIQVPILLPGLAALAILTVACLFNTRRFYGSVGREPTPNRTTQEHLAWSITYLNHRELLYRSNGRWGDALFPVAAILAAMGIFRSDAFSRGQSLVLAVGLAAGWWAANAMTKCVLRQIAEERDRVRRMCDDLAG